MFSSMILRSSFNPAVEIDNYCKEKQMFHVQEKGTGLARRGHACPPFPTHPVFHWHVPRQSLGQLIYSKPSELTFLPLSQKA